MAIPRFEDLFQLEKDGKDCLLAVFFIRGFILQVYYLFFHGPQTVLDANEEQALFQIQLTNGCHMRENQNKQERGDKAEKEEQYLLPTHPTMHLRISVTFSPFCTKYY